MREKRKPRILKNATVWYCPGCHGWKFSDDYYKDKRTPNGLKSQCKECHIEGTMRTKNPENTRRINREYMRRARKKDPEKFNKRSRIASRGRKWTEKTEARYQLNLAVKRGAISKPTQCESCGEYKRVCGHHKDYSKPLEVEWLCYECHAKEHFPLRVKSGYTNSR